MNKLLSVLIPVYNEVHTITKIIDRVHKVPLDKEIIVIDDGSTDGTSEALKSIKESNVKIYFHKKNSGKGSAIKTGLQHINGDIIIIQDADLEYPPEQYPEILKPIYDDCADVVYGTRFIGIHRVFMFWHYMGNKILTLFTNILYDTMLTDMETGYKAWTKSALNGITLKSDGFNIEAELTAKFFKKRTLRIVEVPITYYGRSYKEGKKITWKDAIPTILTLIKYRFLN
ncbi:MAG: glycosyltransferase family 2 protein [Candidatus Firestonebacteria bacterium]